MNNRQYERNAWKSYQKQSFRNELRSQQNYRCRPNVFYAAPTPPEPLKHIPDKFMFHYHFPYYQLYRPSENQWYPYITAKVESGVWSCD